MDRDSDRSAPPNALASHGLSAADQALRGVLTRMVAERGRAPSNAELAAAAGVDEAELEQSLRRLHDTHSLLLHPHKCQPWLVHPFALSAGSCWVDVGEHLGPERGYWANCLYCAFGIAAATGKNAVVTTRFGGERITTAYRIGEGRLLDFHGIFHLSTPAAHWWDNIVAACASFQPFEREEDIDPWCDRHGLPRGATMEMEALWRFASDWYGAYLHDPWRKRTPDEVRDLFARHGLTGPFWEI
jgi:hypothetical protein